MQKPTPSATCDARAAASPDIAGWCLAEPQVSDRMTPGARPSPAAREPALTAVLADPIVRKLMESDGVRMRALQALIIRTRTVLKTGTPVSLS